MSAFKTKIFGMAATAVVFAGMANAQALTCAQGVTIPTLPIVLRAEGVTELVSDDVVTCTGTAAGTTGQVSVALAGANSVTSKSLGGTSEATLTIIDNSGLNAASTYYSGVITGTTINFGNVTFPTFNFRMRISNVRVNVSGLFTNNLTPVTEQLQAITQGVAVVNLPAITVGSIKNGLLVTGSGTVYSGSGSAVAGTAAAVTSHLVCTGGTFASFSVTIQENFPGAFKLKSVPATPPAPQNIPGAESGSLYTGAPGFEAGGTAVAAAQNAASGTATSGTRIKLVYTGIPTNVALSVPTVISNFVPAVGATPAIPASFVLTLVTSETGAFAAAGSGTLANSAGTSTAIYEVTTADLTLVKSATITTSVTYTANSVTAPSGPISVAVSYAPSPATRDTAVPATIPTVPYFVNTATNLTASTFAACQTTLLYPFVTNLLGFETGLVVTNAGKDNLGLAGVSNSGGQSGACTIQFYGSTTALENGTAPATVGTANFPAAAATVNTIAAGRTHADTLTNVMGGSFQGYAIAVCPFLYAKGFAYITYNLTSNNGTAMGYLADVINTNRTSVVAVNNTVGNNTPEASGH